MARDNSRAVMLLIESTFCAGVKTSHGFDVSWLRAAENVVVAMTISSRNIARVVTSISESLR